MFRFIWQVIFLLLPCLAFTQNKQGNNWYFGRYAGLNFNTDPPTPLLDGEINTWEGCATISDKDGNLLMYTDGIKVWDRNHNQMPNGFNLGGDPSSTQSGVIIPHPGNNDLYYVFSVDKEVGKLQYSIVDITVNGGLGDVVSKNNDLLDSSTEKISAVRHANGSGFWVVGHEWGTDNFYLWHITDEGLQLTPKIISIGSIHSGSAINSIGYLKFSTQGDKIAIASYYRGDFVETFDFDNNTGEITNPVKLQEFGGRGPYGLEFSPNGEFLYISEAQGSTGKLHQVKLPAASGKINDISTVLASGKNFGALQLASNGKIYLAQDNQEYINVIHSPNKEGAAANYEFQGQYLGGRDSRNGLPTFIQSLFTSVDFTYDTTCFGDVTAFTIETSTPDKIDSVYWDFGDTPSGVSNNSKNLNPSHVFSVAGSYNVILKTYYSGDSTEVKKVITIYPEPSIDLDTHTLLHTNDQLDFDFSNTNYGFLWENGETTSTRAISSPGWHWIETTSDQDCVKRDSLAVFKVNYADTCLISNTAFEILSGNVDVDSVIWQMDNNSITGKTVSNVFSTPGPKDITASIYYNNTSLSETFQIIVPALPDVNLGADRTLLYGETLDLDVASSGTSFLWYDGSTSPTFTVDSPGTYWVDVTNASGCVQRDSLVITYDQVIDVALPGDATLCLGETLNLDVSLPDASYLWQDGSSSSTYIVDHEGIYWVEITNAFGNRTKVDSIVVDYYEFNEMQVEAEIVICEASDVELNVSGSRVGESYLWYDESMNFLEENLGQFTTSMLNESTDYFVSTTNGTCESEPVRVSVIYDEVFAEIIASDTITKLGEPVELFGFGGDSFEWSPPIWLDNENTQNPITTPEDDIEYTLTVTSARGCTDSETILLLVEKRISIPNVITPNGDGMNDYWEVEYIDRFPGNYVQIFDRNHTLLFETANYQNNWNATYNGQPLPTGVYFYKIDLGDPEFPIQKGSLTVISNEEN
ncbi:MAG: gliding motility-associated C-terminal domain-containing protein [Flavobacteriaceae bacterium]|nr:gliding motility-associated C-terminal domain-containing protein [Flavobacteriaceae bacterium]